MISANNKTTGALIGAGFFADFQAEAWMRMKDVDIVAVVDSVADRSHAFAARHGLLRSYVSAETMFHNEQIDFVDIATRPDSHLALTRLAAQRGVHVISQKPMAPTLADSIAMCEACERAMVRLLIHENWRWQPWYRHAKRVIASGALGALRHLSFDWRTGDGNGPTPFSAQPYFRDMTRLIIFESLVHILDTFRFLAGELQLTSCETRRVNPVIAGEDWAEIRCQFASGATGFVHGDRQTGAVPAPVAMGSMVIEGEHGTLLIKPAGELLLNKEPIKFTPTTLGYKGDSVFATQAHLLRCLITGEPCETEGREYLKTASLVESAYRLSPVPKIT